MSKEELIALLLRLLADQEEVVGLTSGRVEGEDVICVSVGSTDLFITVEEA